MDFIPTNDEINYFMNLYANDRVIPKGERYGRLTYNGMENDETEDWVRIFLTDGKGEVNLCIDYKDLDQWQRTQGITHG